MQSCTQPSHAVKQWPRTALYAPPAGLFFHVIQGCQCRFCGSVRCAYDAVSSCLCTWLEHGRHSGSGDNALLILPACWKCRHPVCAGLVSAPVIAVPSVGAAGAALQGSTGLLGAVAAASTGVAVSQVDSGVGAAMLAARVLRCADRLRQPPAS